MSQPIDKKTEELIALGVSFGLNCRFCMEYHRKIAFEAGATSEEMNAAIQVAENVKNGASGKTREHAKKLFGEVHQERCCPAGSACCP